MLALKPNAARRQNPLMVLAKIGVLAEPPQLRFWSVENAPAPVDLVRAARPARAA